MNDVQRIRYSRQIQLPAFGEAGQERLLAARVWVVGVGGLGSVVTMYLAAAGVGHLILADYDRVDLSNLQRQIAHRYEDVGRLKVDSARDTLLSLNPDADVTVIPRALDDAELDAVLPQCDVVVDACDNFETRFAINRACHRVGVPLVSGAVVGMEGQVAVFPHRRPGGGDDDRRAPCYHCLYPDDGSPGESCARMGILAPVVGIVGAVQATETLKWLVPLGEPLIGRLLLFDALAMTWRTLQIKRDPACPVCMHPPLVQQVSGSE